LSYVESSKASITATIEPVVAASVGVFMFGEILSLLQIAGIILVIVAVIMMQGKDK
jgi:drug/metabolite transporter (DMT)-like permease